MSSEEKMGIQKARGSMHSWIRSFLLISGIATGALLHVCLPAQANADALPALHLTIIGEPRVVFKKSQDACDPNDIPDAPARAVRIASGGVQLYSTYFHGRRLVGPDLRHLSTDCHVVFRGSQRDDPAAFDDRGWIAALYTSDGRTLFAAVHNEFQGHRRKALCPSGKYLDCWYNAVTAAMSHDAGDHFVRQVAGPDLIAALPYRYDEVTGHHAGYFNPSNIVSYGGGLFMMVFATKVQAQMPGNCLLRTVNIADPAAWRAWNGRGFAIAFVDPYTRSEPPEEHVCTPVGAGQLRWPVASLVRHAPSGLFVALMMNAGRDGGVFYATSPDLIDWSAPARLMDGLGEAAYRCGDKAPLAYPSLLDPNSPDLSFATVGASADMFLTRFNIAGCRASMDRDLISIPVRIAR